MKGRFDFTVDNLGPCKVPSPIQLSKKHGDFKANYVKDNEFVRYNVDVYDDVLETEADAYNNNESIYITVSAVNAEGFDGLSLTPSVEANGVAISGEEM